MKIRKPIQNINEGNLIACKLAEKKQKAPLLSVILVDFAEPIIESKVSKLTYGFYKVQKRIIGGDVVNAVWVEINNISSEAKVTSCGDFSPEQLKQITNFVGSDEFPSAPLNLDQVSLEVSDILCLIRKNPISKSIPSEELGSIKLNLQTQENKSIWTVQQEVPNVGYRGMRIDAHTGKIIYDKTDWLNGIEK
jgi:hypothetical protein